MATTIPTEITTAELARCLGISERRVATLKAEGRVPASAAGHVHLPDLLNSLYRECADHRARLATAGGTRRHDPPRHWGDRYPADAMAGLALNVMAMLAPRAAVEAAREAGIEQDAVDRLRRAMLTTAARLREEAREKCGILRDPDGPDPLAEVPDLAP